MTLFRTDLAKVTNMADITREDVIDALKTVIDPDRGRDVISAEMVQGIVVRDVPDGGAEIGFALEVSPDEGERKEPLRMAAIDAVRRLPGVARVNAILTAHSESPGDRPASPAPAAGGPQEQRARPAPQGIPGVASIIAVASGKGGVGKSTVAVNLAMALARLGKRVGILDADIYGPSVPRMLGLSGKPETTPDQKLKPMQAHGVVCMSIGFLVEEDTPMIWRGPMVMSALSQMMTDVKWGELDVLVVDMPPGTGDAQLTMAQRVPLAGGIIVSTPQDIALIDARKGLAMFRRTNVPVFGIIENMSTFVCPHCGKESHIFGHGGARETAEKLGCDFLGEIPLHMAIRETSDSGAPIVVSAPESPQAQAFVSLAERVSADLGRSERPAPRIVIE